MSSSFSTHNDSKAESWSMVWALLKQHNPGFHLEGQSGMEAVIIEIRRLQALDGSKPQAAQPKQVLG